MRLYNVVDIAQLAYRLVPFIDKYIIYISVGVLDRIDPKDGTRSRKGYKYTEGLKLNANRRCVPTPIEK